VILEVIPDLLTDISTRLTGAEPDFHPVDAAGIAFAASDFVS
jgi:hypothetical protein